MKDLGNKYISRGENESGLSGYWLVRFRKDNGVPAQRKFTDLKHGGKSNALAVARAWRDVTAVQLDKFNDVDRVHHLRKRFKTVPRGRSEHVGVTFIDDVSPDGRPRCCFITVWRETLDDGSRASRSKTFTVKPGNQVSYDRQFKAAVKHRKRMERLHYLGPQRK